MVQISLIPEKIIDIGSLHITNTLLMSWLITIAISIFAILFSRTIKNTPGKLQNIVEAFIEALLDFFEMIVGNRDTVKRFFPLVGTIFIFILVANWSGLIPGLSSLGIVEHEGEEQFVIPALRSAYSDINMTLALALIVIVTTQVVGLKTLGRKYISKFIDFRGPIKFFTGI